jgi:hypothetical protein
MLFLQIALGILVAWLLMMLVTEGYPLVAGLILLVLIIFLGSSK